MFAGGLEFLGSWRIFFLIDVPLALAVLWFLRGRTDPAAGGTPDGVAATVPLPAPTAPPVARPRPGCRGAPTSSRSRR